MKVLVVDDEPIVLKSCRMVLEAEGFEVMMAGSVQEALAAIEAHASPSITRAKNPGPTVIAVSKRTKDVREQSPTGTRSFPTPGSS